MIHDYGTITDYFEPLGDLFPEFYLVGGTALSFFYLDHRSSDDIDLFVPEETWNSLEDITIQQRLNKFDSKLNVTTEHVTDFENSSGAIVGQRFTINNQASSTKLDLVMDPNDLSISPRTDNEFDLNVASIDDLYSRKLMIALKTDQSILNVSRDAGSGRRKVRDLLDIYTLSKDHAPLAHKLDSIHTDNPLELATNFQDYVEKFSKRKILSEIDDTNFELEDHSMDPDVIVKHLLDEITRFRQEKIRDVTNESDQE